MTEEQFPPEVQKEPGEFAFHELSHVKAVTTDRQPYYDTVRSNLLTVANRYGYVFVGTPNGLKVFLESDIANAAKSSSKEVVSHIATVSLRNRPNWLGLSIDELTLCICCRTEKGPQILFFDTRNIVNSSKPSKTPFYQQCLSDDDGAYVIDLMWNPCEDFSNFIAVCLSTGSFHLLSIGEKDVDVISKPSSFGASAVYWSWEGKHIMVGKKDGTLEKFTQALESCQSVSVTNVIDKPVKTCDLIWLSTNQVGAAYISRDDNDGYNQPNLFLANIAEPGEDTVWKNYEDPCFGVGESRESQYFFIFIRRWQMFIVLCSNSTEIVVIAENKQSEIWEIWTLSDSSRAALPISPYTGEDSAPIGVSITTTATDRVTLGESKECGPMPVMLILTDDGILCSYRMINLMEYYPSLVESPKALSLIGERNFILLDNKKPTSKEIRSDQANLVLTKKKLSAKPSVAPMTASKSVSSLPTSCLPSSPLSSSTPLLEKVSRVHPFADESSITKDEAGSYAKLTPKKPAFTKGPTQAIPSENFGVTGSRSASRPQPSTLFPTKSGTPTSLKSSERSSSGLVEHCHTKTDTAFRTTIPQKKGESFKGSGSESASQPSHFTVKFDGTERNAAGSQKSSKRLSSALSETKIVKTHDEGTISWKQKHPSDLHAMFDDIANFDVEMSDFRSSLQEAENCLSGIEQTIESIQLEKLAHFSKDISKTSLDLANEMQDTSTYLLALISDAEGMKQKFNSQALGSYRALLYSRPLDRPRDEKLKAIQDLYHYMVRCLEDVNSTLDSQWEEARKRANVTSSAYGEKKCNYQHTSLKMAEWEAAYQGLFSNLKLVHSQELKITLLSQQIDQLRVLDASRSAWLSGKLASSSDELRGDLQTLADTLLCQKVADGKPAKHGPDRSKLKQQKLSQRKRAQLGQILAKHRVKSVNASGRHTSSIMRPYPTRREPIEETPKSFSPTTEESSDYEDTGFSPEIIYPAAAAATVLPQGSATFGYGAPPSAKVEIRRRNLPTITAADDVQAASNLNNPPQVVNIQTCSDSIPTQPQLPDIFEPSPQVPIGAVEVVQTVLNMVKSEKNRGQQKMDFVTKGQADEREQPRLTSQFVPTSIFNSLQSDKASNSHGSNEHHEPDSNAGAPAPVCSPIVTSASVPTLGEIASYLESKTEIPAEEERFERSQFQAKPIVREIPESSVKSADIPQRATAMNENQNIGSKVTHFPTSASEVKSKSATTHGAPPCMPILVGGRDEVDSEVGTGSGNMAEEVQQPDVAGPDQDSCVQNNLVVHSSATDAATTNSASLAFNTCVLASTTPVNDVPQPVTCFSMTAKVSKNTVPPFHTAALTWGAASSPPQTQTDVSSVFGVFGKETPSVSSFQTSATFNVPVSNGEGIVQTMDENIPPATDEEKLEVPAFSSTKEDLPATTGFGGFSISGLDQKPTAEMTGRNPFGVTAQSAVKTDTSLFGSNPQGPLTFAAPPQFPAFALKGSSENVTSQGFNVFNKSQQSHFGAAPTFGSSALFGSPPSLGSIGSGTFGMQSSAGVFGQSTGGGFESFGKGETLGFGSLANKNNAGMQQQSGFLQSKLDANSQKSPSFSGWR